MLFLATTNMLGGDNTYLGIAYLVVGGMALLLALAFVIKKILFKKSDNHYD